MPRFPAGPGRSGPRRGPATERREREKQHAVRGREPEGEKVGMKRWVRRDRVPNGGRARRPGGRRPGWASRFAVAVVCVVLGAPGVVIGQEDQAGSGPGPVEGTAEAGAVSPAQDRTDEEIRGDLQAVFDQVPAFSGLSATVTAGVVTLVGEVPDSDAAGRALDLARSQAGVRLRRRQPGHVARGRRATREPVVAGRRSAGRSQADAPPPRRPPS